MPIVCRFINGMVVVSPCFTRKDVIDTISTSLFNIHLAELHEAVATTLHTSEHATTFVKNQDDFPNVKIWAKFAPALLTQTYETCDIKHIKFTSNRRGAHTAWRYNP